MRRVLFQTKIKPDVASWIKKYCQKHDKSKSQFGREAIYHYVELKRKAQAEHNKVETTE